MCSLLSLQYHRKSKQYDWSLSLWYASRISALNFRKPYLYCENHDLNLALCQAVKSTTVNVIMDNLAIRLFNYSPKWLMYLHSF